MSGTCDLTFQIECIATKPGEAVFVVGSAPEIGAWDPSKAVPCLTSPKVFPNWTSQTVTLPANTGNIEFKVLVQAADGKKPASARWEGGPNRCLTIPEGKGGLVQLSASCSWGLPEVTYRTKLDGGTVGGGQGLRPEPTPAPGPATEEPKKGQEPKKSAETLMPRLETGVHFGLEEFVDESGDSLGPLENASSSNLLRKASRNHSQTMAERMQRRSSRHLCINNDGMLNSDMSRVPSMMLIDASELEEDTKKYTEEVEKLERDSLNIMQRRMPSGSLLEKMEEVIGSADKDSIVLLQGFNWESWRAGAGDWYSVIGKSVDKFKHVGVTDIWLPPPSSSVAPQGYLPSQLFNLDGSKYGTQASLETLIKTLHENGIRAIADIVVNHRCGDKQDSQGRWNQFTSGMEHRPSFAGVMDWGGWAITLGDTYSDGTGENAPGRHDGKFDAAPNIDHANQKVQQSIAIWLRWLQLQVGFDGWRFDFVKGYSAEFVGLYCKKSAPAWAVGELWGDMQYDDNGLAANQDRHRQEITNWVNSTDKQSTAFDFTTKGILQEACKNCQYWRLKDANGKPPGLIGWMPKYAVTFIDNHDTGSTQRHWPFPDDKVLVGYAYICTHPGIPALFWDHVMDWGENVRNQIADLLRVRRESGIPVDAPVNIIRADADSYVAEIGSPAALRVALGPRHAGDADGSYWEQGPQGKDYRVWIHKKPAPTPPPAPTPAKSPAQASPTKGPAKAETLSDVSFPDITVDGVKLTQAKLKAMSKQEVEQLVGKLEPLLNASKLAKALKK
mmetsp:Transcript_66095/g.215010  ORF Transcript_66095/g.215010 Transcript_66095/m.215010 type:complete len:785 (+) Transcript_66095:111-2465(+)